MSTPLHSRSTFFYKWIYPWLWSAIFGLVAVVMLFDVLAARPRPDGFVHLLLAAVWPLGSAYLFWFAGRLRVVHVDGDVLVISGGRGNAEYVPVLDIVSVSETRFWSPRLIVIHYSRPGGHQGTARILPRFALRWPFALHPDVRYLRALATAARHDAASRQWYGRT